MIDETLGSYRVVAKIGEGGMGTVYLAEHPLLGRKAAIKMLRPEYSNDQDAVARFFREARATATLRHPALVDIYDCGVHPSGNAYIVMDYLEGESLEERVTRTTLSLRESLDIGRQIAKGLAVAHGAGIVHRDLKPGNVFLIRDPVNREKELVKILDFGIAKLTNHAAPPGQTTGTNVVMGTPLYMAPEQCAGAGGVDHRADIYALGCVLYRMLCGRPVFTYEWPGELLAAHLRESPLPPRALDSSIPVRVESIIMKALAKSPLQRHQVLEEMVQDLESALAWESPVVATPGSGTLLAPADPFHSHASPDSSERIASAPGRDASRRSRGGAPARWSRAHGLTLLGGVAVSAIVAGVALRREPSGPPPIATAAPLSIVPGSLSADESPATVGQGTDLAVGDDARAAQQAAETRDPRSKSSSQETIRITISNARARLAVKVDGRTVSLPLHLPRDAAMHELSFETPNFRPEKRRLRADRDQIITLENKPAFFVP
ncbi:MAG TPA: serine/threonine-protein kinase [Polyangiaceae bacterium]|nr:serine/threonine-protein kinase [Polyangiaceae bacterium]